MHHKQNTDQISDTATDHHDATSVGRNEADAPATMPLSEAEVASTLDDAFPRKTRGKPRASPVGQSLGLPQGLALGLDQGPAQGLAPGNGAGGTADWSLWWGTFRNIPGARLQVWRCSDAGLNLGEPILVMTVADAQQRRLDDEATAHAFLASRCGAGRYRFTPRSEQGAKLPGTHSLVTVIVEDTTMPSPTPNTSPMITAPMDHDTAIEIERMRLAAEMEREREARRERQREQREERRRERDQERERRRQEDRTRRDDDERRRSERDAQTQTMLMQVLKEMAAGRGSGNADPLVAAALAKLGQPDPLVLKLLDTHGKREELTDFFKVQAESMRMASTLQTDSLKQVMAASQDVQAQLIRQAAEVASHRAGGDQWDGLGSVLGATAQVISALKAQPPQQQAGATSSALALPVPTMPVSATPATRPTLAHSSREMPPAPASAAAPAIVTAQSGLVRSLQDLRSHHARGRDLDDGDLSQVAALLPPSVREIIVAGEADSLQHAVIAALTEDPTLSRWLGQPGVGEWLTTTVQRLRELLLGIRPLANADEHEDASDPIL